MDDRVKVESPIIKRVDLSKSLRLEVGRFNLQADTVVQGKAVDLIESSLFEETSQLYTHARFTQTSTEFEQLVQCPVFVVLASKRVSRGTN